MNIHELNTKLKRLKQNGELSGAKSLLDDWLVSHDTKSNRWLAGITLITFALTEGCIEEAFSYASDLAKVDSADPHLNYLSGLILRLLGNPHQARTYLDQALTLGKTSNDPNLFAYTTELCKVYLDLDMFDECDRLCFSDWNLDDPIDPKIAPKIIARLLVLSNLYRRQRFYQESIEYMKRASRLANNLPDFCAMRILEDLISIQALV